MRLHRKEPCDSRAPPESTSLIARQWWYRSRPFKFDLAPDQEIRLVVDLVRDGSLLRRILFLMFMPWRGVVVKAAA